MKQKKNTLSARHIEICELLYNKGSVSVDELCKHFKVSEVSIRKDLSFLESENLLIRTHGGALSIEQVNRNSLPNKINRDISVEKLAIAKKAVSFISNNLRIIIDSGTTTRSIIPELNNFHNLVVMTNSFMVAEQLLNLENQPTLLMTGGTWDSRSSSFQGQAAEKMLQHYNFDLLLIGADGIDLDNGTTTYNEVTSLSKAMAIVADKVILLLESGKLSRKIPNIELTWDQIDIMITDEKIDPKIKKQIEQKNVEVVIAKL